MGNPSILLSILYLLIIINTISPIKIIFNKYLYLIRYHHKFHNLVKIRLEII